MVLGDPGVWAARFRTLDDRFLERVVAVWPRCLKVLPENPDEDMITENLVTMVSKDHRPGESSTIWSITLSRSAIRLKVSPTAKVRSTWPCCWTRNETDIWPTSASG